LPAIVGSALVAPRALKNCSVPPAIVRTISPATYGALAGNWGIEFGLNSFILRHAVEGGAEFVWVVAAT
jgi:hypothetical protein